MKTLGLTGSIGMGKSTTARLFEEAGAAVFDSDRAVHDLYQTAAVAPIAAQFPNVVKAGKVDRKILAEHVLSNPEALQQLEAIVHPLVRQAQQAFLNQARQQEYQLAVLDIPLLFETGAQSRFDKTVVVSAPEEIQRARVLARPGMDEKKFQQLLNRQMSDAEKRKKADYIIYTDRGIEDARKQVQDIIQTLTGW